MTIPYGRQSISDDDINAVVAALRSSWLTTGPEVDKFESRIAAVSGAKGAVAVSSGTAALHAAYFACDLKPGDEVITSPLTFVATAAMAAMFGAKIIFADVQPDTGNIDPESVAKLITRKTKVISGIDYAGHPVDIDELRNLANNTGAIFLEDAAHSIGSTYKGRPVGADADITTYSFFPTKNLTTAEGGAIVSPNSIIESRARRFRMHGLVREHAELRDKEVGAWHQEVHHFGLNYRLPDVLCALGSSQIDRISEFKASRSKIFDTYSSELADIEWITLPTKRDYVDPMWHLFPIRVPESQRKAVFNHLRADEIAVQVNYIPVYWHPVFEDLGYAKGLCPKAEQYYREEISIPMYSDLTDGDLQKVVDSLKAFHIGQP